VPFKKVLVLRLFGVQLVVLLSGDWIIYGFIYWWVHPQWAEGRQAWFEAHLGVCLCPQTLAHCFLPAMR
jgi:hypothetical protein